jgi:hypothetical protein
MFIAVVLAKNAELNWEAVARGFDHPQFSLPDQTAFRNLMNVWAKATPEAFPLNAVVGDPTWPLWHNTRGHVQFLQFAIAERDPSVFTFEHALRKQPPLEGLKSAPLSCPSLCHRFWGGGFLGGAGVVLSFGIGVLCSWPEQPGA